MTLLIWFLLWQSTVPREVVQLARIKHDMSAVLNQMPDYMCEEIVRRSAKEARAKKFVDVDEMRLDVAFLGGTEVFGKHESGGRLDKISPNSFTGHGVTSTGEFVGHARSVFLNGGATSRYFGLDELAGRKALRWDYTIPLLTSGWTLNYAGRMTRVASKGSFWVEPDSLDLLQLDVDATEIETGFPIAATHLSIRYGKVKLGERIVTIAQGSDLLLTGANGTLERNLVEFKRCRAYGAESVISFDK